MCRKRRTVLDKVLFPYYSITVLPCLAFSFLSVRACSHDPYKSEMRAGLAALLATFFASGKPLEILPEASDGNNSNGFTQHFPTVTGVLEQGTRWLRGDQM